MGETFTSETRSVLDGLHMLAARFSTGPDIERTAIPFPYSSCSSANKNMEFEKAPERIDMSDCEAISLQKAVGAVITMKITGRQVDVVPKFQSQYRPHPAGPRPNCW